MLRSQFRPKSDLSTNLRQSYMFKKKPAKPPCIIYIPCLEWNLSLLGSFKTISRETFLVTKFVDVRTSFSCHVMSVLSAMIRPSRRLTTKAEVTKPPQPTAQTTTSAPNRVPATPAPASPEEV